MTKLYKGHVSTDAVLLSELGSTALGKAIVTTHGHNAAHLPSRVIVHLRMSCKQGLLH